MARRVASSSLSWVAILRITSERSLWNPVIREREPLQGDLERSSPSFSTVLLPGRELVPGPLLLAQNDTQTEVSSSHNAFSMCKLRWMKVQCPTVPRYPSRLFCLCTLGSRLCPWYTSRAYTGLVGFWRLLGTEI